jgi:hypothetical protein
VSLERRYRLLLRAYPPAWRREREQEILGVLMAGAPAGRRRPTAGEAADLLLRGMQARLKRGASTWRADWGQGARVAGVVLAVMLGAVAVRMLVPMLGLVLASPNASSAGERLTDVLYGSRLWWADAAAWSGWLLTAIVVACGWARLAGPLAVASAIAQLGVLGALGVVAATGSLDEVTANLGWAVAGAFAAAALARPGQARQAIRTLGRPGLALLLVASGGLLAAEPVVWLVWGPWSVPPVTALSPLAMAVPLAVSAWLLGRRSAGRRAMPFLAACFALFLGGRVLASDLPVLAPAYGLEQWGYQVYLRLGLARVVFLGLVPVLVLALCLLAAQRLERRLSR